MLEEYAGNFRTQCNPILHAELCGVPLQDAVRGDHGEVAQLLMSHGAKIFKTKENRLVDLNRSHLAG